MKHKDLMSEKHKNVCRRLNYFEKIFVFVFAVRRSVPISAFPSVLSVPASTTNSAVGLEICASIAEIRNCKSIIKKKRKKRDKIVMLAKTK